MASDDGRGCAVETIRTEASATALWQKLVKDAEGRAARALGDELESYLVFTLMRHQTHVALAGRVMALEWLESHLAHGRRREQGLRDLGDACLLIAGLYPERAEHKVSLSYFQDLGRDAYFRLGDDARHGLAELFRHLGQAFAELVRVLFEVRRLDAAAAPIDPAVAHAWCESNGRIVPERAQEMFPGAIVLPAHGGRQ
jgi:hypothetical protein